MCSPFSSVIVKVSTTVPMDVNTLPNHINLCMHSFFSFFTYDFITVCYTNHNISQFKFEIYIYIYIKCNIVKANSILGIQLRG